jgi:hypothetical protein
MSDCGVTYRDRVFVMAWAVEGFFAPCVVVAGAGWAPMPCLLGGGRSILPSPFEVVGDPSMKSPIMVCCEDGGPSRVEPMMMASELPPMGERLKPSKWSVMNSRLPKWMVSPREEPSLNKCSPPVATASADDGTIGTSKWRAHYKSHFLAHQLLVFFAPVRYRMVKVAHSCSDVVLRTTKHTTVYPSSGPSSEVIPLRPAIWY